MAQKKKKRVKRASGLEAAREEARAPAGTVVAWPADNAQGEAELEELRVVDLLWPPLLIKPFLYKTWVAIDREAEVERAARRAAGKGYDWRPLAVLCFGAVCLALMEYFGHGTHLRQLMDHYAPLGSPEADDSFLGELRVSPFRQLAELGYWALWRVLGFFVLPALFVKLVLRERIRDHGLRTKGFLSHAWIYGLFFCIVLVAVIVVSFENSFQTYYPFYRLSGRSWLDFWSWELLYAAQFFSLEFFFRGFWLKASKSAMGSHAIYAMVVPYCMIHFGKPFPETIAAILAGVILGTLALRTRSIWAGFLIHVSVAVSMDLAALLQTDSIPSEWLPPFM